MSTRASFNSLSGKRNGGLTLALGLQFNLSSAQIERNKTKEQLEEEKKISLSFRIKPLVLDNMSVDKLQLKASDLWEQIVKLETEKYDLEERQKRQDYDVSADAPDVFALTRREGSVYSSTALPCS